MIWTLNGLERVRGWLKRETTLSFILIPRLNLVITNLFFFFVLRKGYEGWRDRRSMREKKHAYP